MTPKLSIITITFNAQRFLPKTIDSILAQTCHDFEYIIVDGKSKDATVEIIQDYERRIQDSERPFPIRWVSEPDKGLYDAMNKGIKMANGDFVWFMNAGDKIYNERTVETILKNLEASPTADVIYGQSLIIDENDNPLGERHKIAPKVLTRKSLLNGLVVCHQSILVRTSIAPDYDLSYKIAADYDWTCKVLTASKNNLYIDEYLSRFMTAGVSSKQRKKAWKERYTIMKRHFGLCATLWAHFKIVVRYPFTTKY